MMPLSKFLASAGGVKGHECQNLWNPRNFGHFLRFSTQIVTFFSVNNGARMIFRGLNDLSVQAESNDTHYDHDLKIFGSRLGHYVSYTSHR